MDFDFASDRISKMVDLLTDAQKLEMYALYKQATAGDCVAAEPSVLKPRERAKWKAWSALSGTPPARAADLYVAAARVILSSATAWTQPV